MTDDQIPADAPDASTEPRPALTRSGRHRVVAGVCGGLGRYLDIDPVVFRVVLAVLGLTGGLGLFLYGLAWLVIPREAADEEGRTELQRVLTGRVDGQSIGAVLLTVIGTGVFFSSMNDGDQLFPLLLLAALVFLALRYDPERRRRFQGGDAGPEPKRTGGPYDRLEPSGTFADWKTWGEAMSRDLRGEWQARTADLHERIAARHEERPADTPPAGPSGYLWDPRHPERNPYSAAPGAPAQPWWQRTDLPDGDPLRKGSAEPQDHMAGYRERMAAFHDGAAERRQAQREAMEQRRENMRRHREWKAERRRQRGRSGLGAWAVLVAIGASWAVAASDHGNHRWSTVLAVALLPLGLAMMLSARWGRTRGLTFVSLLLTVGLVFAASTSATVAGTVGDRTWTAADDNLHSQYTAGIGDARLDLSALDPKGGVVVTALRVGIGNATVRVPDGVELRLKLRDGVGEVSLPDGQDYNGPVTDENVVIEVPQGQPSKGVLDLTVTMGIGDIRVER
ncbi:PspC domain-containing protein [Kitasatospora sp. NPDC092948]|uniref:PspC domain-containing protein n=1 Tax=Kitasatospora sp. NPDC092948 TaxID=3364088 RepID=UPI0037FE053C